MSINSMDNIYQHASAQLKQKTRALVDRLFQGKVRDFLKEHARLLDAYFIEAFETSMVGPRMNISKNPYAIIALGGYGREEQCIHSDVDLLFLFKKRIKIFLDCICKLTEPWTIFLGNRAKLLHN